MVSTLREGAVAGEVFARGEEQARSLGLSGYLGHPGHRRRFVGHGIGLEIVEPPLIAQGGKEVLQLFSAVALEPKAIIGNLGGVGVEDTLLLDDTGVHPPCLDPPGAAPGLTNPLCSQALREYSAFCVWRHWSQSRLVRRREATPRNGPSCLPSAWTNQSLSHKTHFPKLKRYNSSGSWEPSSIFQKFRTKKGPDSGQ